MGNPLEVIVQESGLEKSKAQVILDKFKDCFEVAAEWEKEAKEIVVTDASQTDIMEKAKEGRKILSAKRIEIENTRKSLKENALREGQAIDGIAKTLKALIIPIEDYLKRQECFIQIKKAKEDEEILRLAHIKQEEERLAIEKYEQEEADRIAKIEHEKQERIRIENKKLKKEAEKRNREIERNRVKARAEKIALEEKACQEREEAECLARIEREKQEKILAEQKAEADKERKEREALETKLASQIECPYCHKKFVPEK